jgi:hypothetical protein
MKRSCSHLIAIVTMSRLCVNKGFAVLGGVSSLVGIVFGFLQLRIQVSPLSQCSFVYMVNLHSSRLC